MPSTDVVYKIGPKCSKTWPDYGELRFSLRSLSLFKDLGRVFIIGHCPEWAQNVVHIPCDDPYKENKDANLINKMVLACCNDVSQYFVNMSDDQFFSKATTTKEIIPVGMIRNSSGKDPWHTRLRNTQKALKENGKPHEYHFEGHCPYLLNKHGYPAAVLQYCYGHKAGMLGNTLYHNHHKIPPQPNDNHIAGVKTSIKDADIEQLGQQYRFLNINHGTTEVHRNYLQNRFPDKSPYER